MKKLLNFRCPNCDKRGISILSVIISDMGGGCVKCPYCANGCEHPGWEKTTITVLLILGVGIFLAAGASESDRHPHLLRASFFTSFIVLCSGVLSAIVPLRVAHTTRTLSAKWLQMIMRALLLGIPLSFCMVTGILWLCGDSFSETWRIVLESVQHFLVLVFFLTLMATWDEVKQLAQQIMTKSVGDGTESK